MRNVPLADLARESRFRVDEMCRMLQISDRHLYRVFMKSLGLAPKDWLRRQRMVEARFLLRDGAAVKQAAIELGFSHPKDFTREFRSCYELTPSTFIDREADRAFA